MLMCIPTRGDAGLDDMVNDHFGSAPFFTMCDSETDAVTVLPNSNAKHRHGHCQPLAQLTGHDLDCVVCTGMGRRAVEMLGRKGIKVYLADIRDVREVITRLKSGTLTELDPAQACQGHGHGQRKGQGSSSGCGGHGNGPHGGFGAGGRGR